MREQTRSVWQERPGDSAVYGDEQSQPAEQVLLFELGGQRFAVRVADVIELLRVVAIQRLPCAPEVVEGIIDVRGEVMPVLDIRARFRLPPKPVDLSDQLIVARAGVRIVAIRVDRCLEFATVDVLPLTSLSNLFVPGIGHVSGVAKSPDGLLVIHDLATFLTEAESMDLDGILADRTADEAP